MAHSQARERWSDGELLAAVADADGEAFAAFYRRHLALVVRCLLRGTGDREAAADLTAEVFAAVLLHASRYRDDGGTAVPWLIGIARNKLRLSRRRRRIEDAARRRLGFEPVACEDEDLDRLERLAAEAEVDVLIDRLPAHEREAVRRRVLEEQSYETIAGALACSQMVVRKRVSRGLARLRERIEET